MRIEPDTKLDFRDVLVRPKRSTLQSRADVTVERHFKFLHSSLEWKGFPLIASNMDTIGTMAMAKALDSFSAMVAIHKYYSVNQLADFFGSKVARNAFYTLGSGEDEMVRLRAVNDRIPIAKICVDVANGYLEHFVETVKAIRDAVPNAIVMAGSVVTGEMAEALILAGADIVRVGIGSGSVCTTRQLTGVGYPQLSAIVECADAAHGLGGRVCSDGGCVVPGDIAKAFGAGADFVMVGGMLAGHDECEGEVQYEMRDEQRVPLSMTFYGMASETAMKKHLGGIADYRAAEGKTVRVPYRGAVEHTMQEILGGVRSMMTYIGAIELREISKRTTFVRVNRQSNEVFT